MRSVEIRAGRRSGVPVVTASGVLTVAACIHVLKEISAEVEKGPPACAVILDLRGCISAIGTAGWIQVASYGSVRATKLPLIYVVTLEQEADMRDLCVRMARYGRLRLTSISLDCALEWASERARLAPSEGTRPACV